MQPWPVPCPAGLIPDVTGTDAFHNAYRNAMANRAVFVAVECEGRRWTVNADTLTAGSGHTVAGSVNEEVRAAITRLEERHGVDWGAYTGPIYFVMHGVRTEERADPRSRAPRPSKPCARALRGASSSRATRPRLFLFRPAGVGPLHIAHRPARRRRG